MVEARVCSTRPGAVPCTCRTVGAARDLGRVKGMCFLLSRARQGGIDDILVLDAGVFHNAHCQWKAVGCLNDVIVSTLFVNLKKK